MKTKTVKTERKSQTRLDYAEVHPIFAGTAKTEKTIHSLLYVSYSENGFLCFSSDDVFSCAATSGDGRACA